MDGKADRLRYKGGILSLEGDSESLITRSKDGKTTFLLRAKTISVNLKSQKIEGGDGSFIQLTPEPKQPENDEDK